MVGGRAGAVPPQRLLPLSRRPIDLMTVKRNVENGTIRATSDFQRDVMLMLLNAKMYNPRHSDVHRMAAHMMHDAVAIIEVRRHAPRRAR